VLMLEAFQVNFNCLLTMLKRSQHNCLLGDAEAESASPTAATGSHVTVLQLPI
jgi:hypothetical protein